MPEKPNETLNGNNTEPLNPEVIIHQLIKDTIQLKPLEINFLEEDK
jgi:hypothetical protein